MQKRSNLSQLTTALTAILCLQTLFMVFLSYAIAAQLTPGWAPFTGSAVACILMAAPIALIGWNARPSLTGTFLRSRQILLLLALSPIAGLIASQLIGFAFSLAPAASSLSLLSLSAALVSGAIFLSLAAYLVSVIGITSLFVVATWRQNKADLL